MVEKVTIAKGYKEALDMDLSLVPCFLDLRN